MSSTATLGTAKKWPLYRGGRSVDGFQSKLVSKLAWLDFVRPLLTGGRYSELVVNTGLTGFWVIWDLVNLGQFDHINQMITVSLIT
jgi:hypothetical protein